MQCLAMRQEKKQRLNYLSPTVAQSVTNDTCVQTGAAGREGGVDWQALRTQSQKKYTR